MPSLIDAGLYVALAAFVAYEIKEEARDLYSSQDKDHPESTAFGDGCGKFVHWNKVEPKDTFGKIIQKTRALNSNQLELPVWRRSLAVAFIITAVILIVVHKELLPFPKFLLYFIIIFFMFYYSFNYYSYHYSKPLCDVQNENLLRLRDKYKRLAVRRRSELKKS